MLSTHSTPTLLPPAQLNQDTKQTSVFLQNACLQHRYIRSKDTSAIFERPERLRAVTVGLCAVIARLEDALQHKPHPVLSKPEVNNNAVDPNDLVSAMGRMNLATKLVKSYRTPISIVQSHASIDILNHPAVKFIHGDVDGDIYLENMKSWIKKSWDEIHKGNSEIPEGLNQNDLYLCPESSNAIEGAIGTVCEAVDKVISSSRDRSQSQEDIPVDDLVHRAFVVIRPPGHHCGENNPSGFCFVNNVAIAAAHAHLQHGICRVVILDIDLHHGNGTQSIVWQINEETFRQTLESEDGGVPPAKSGPQIYYGSVHDILSYPCEDGKPSLVQAASVSIHNSHGQYIENVHLQTYTSEQHFWDVLYEGQYMKLISKAKEFLDGTGGPGDDVMVFISCGMDACEHEYAAMSRHNRKVPASFYYRFTRDVCSFSDRYARGRVVSILEGGYSDRALISGTMAHLSGLVDTSEAHGTVEEDWWHIHNLEKLENTAKKRPGRRSLPITNSVEPWLGRTLTLFSSLDAPAPLSSRSVPIPPTSMTLRGRKVSKDINQALSPTTRKTTLTVAGETNHAEGSDKGQSNSPPSTTARKQQAQPPDSTSAEDDNHVAVPKKKPRVILRLGPEPNVSSS